MDRVNHMDVKFIWGNSSYQYVSSDSAGSSGGILCVWEATIFKKDYATVSDNFFAVYETWISNNSKNCGENKSPGPDGYTFEFFRRHWRFIGSNFCLDVECFFESWSFPKGSNSSFIDLIPKVIDAKFITDLRPISLIGCVYKVVTKILANRLATVISDLVYDIQSAFVANRQILDGSFIINELLAWCKRKKKQAMIFKVDLDKAYDSVRWDYLLDVLQAFVQKLHSRLSMWKVKTLSIGGRLTLLKSVLGASPLYNMSIYKVPKGVLKEMEAIRCNFFNGVDHAERKITWVSWDKVLASKKNGGLGVSSIHALNRAQLLKWVWRFLSQDGSLCVSGTVIILGSGMILRSVRDGVERQQWDDLNSVSGSVTLSASKDRWICALNGDGVFRVKEVRTTLDDIFLHSVADATRLVKYISIKINVFAWRARLDRLPTRSNLVRRGVVLDSSLCPLCGLAPEDILCHVSV
uniref:RNA-directed DNA polymerase, eukaryota n=1 Tax=Tanacetum cinerariifolium TaxID=118510 RepID=A0A6L2LCX8_TANCI|nr:RNA-directed DNA polymerase, eukaryota [Tanacetum cinerariifolium]